MAFSGETVAVLVDQKAEEIPQKGTDTKTWLGWRLVGVFLDVHTGQLLATCTWVAYLPWPNTFFRTADGNFLFVMRRFPKPVHIPTSPSELQLINGPLPTTLLLLSPTGKELKKLELPIDAASKDAHWEGYVSSTGKSLLLDLQEDKSCQFAVLDADTLTKRLSWTDSGKCAVMAISDKQMLVNRSGRHLIGKFGGPLDAIALPSFNAQFLTDDSIVTFGAAPWGDAWITSSTGRQIESIHFDISDPGPHGIRPGVTPAFVSPDGQRFGTVADQIVGSILFRKGERTLYVWQEPENKLLFTAQLKYYFAQRAESALSGDGSHLAVLSGRKVSMYELPAR